MTLIVATPNFFSTRCNFFTNLQDITYQKIGIVIITVVRNSDLSTVTVLLILCYCY